jgi:putative intracellular protease/amidase/uncharacterized protein (DUF952 family)
VRWLYHVRLAENLDLASTAEFSVEPYAPDSLEAEGFVHASFRDETATSAKLYFPPGSALDSLLEVICIDPRRLDVPVVIADTPRGKMPHIHGPIPREAIRSTISVDELSAVPDRVTGTRFAFVAFEGMTLLDLVGVYDPISRIASMGFDPTSSCEIVSATTSKTVWRGASGELVAERVRPELDEFDVVIVAGGHAARELAKDPAISQWLAAFPANRCLASVCTGALFLGAAGRLRGRRATTHHGAMDLLLQYGAKAVSERVVDGGTVVTAGGVTSGIDLGLHLVRRFEDEEVGAKIAAQMEYRLPRDP